MPYIAIATSGRTRISFLKEEVFSPLGLMGEKLSILSVISLSLLWTKKTHTGSG